MTVEHRIDGVLLTNRVELVDGIDGGLVTAAFRGEVGRGGVIIDDPTGALNLTIWRSYTVDDTAATPTRVFTGRAIDKTVGRLGKQVEGTARTWNVSIEDLNNELHRVLVRFQDNDGKRLAETDVVRLTWLLGSRALLGIVSDEGLVSSAGAVALLGQDERQKFADDIMTEFAVIAGKNYYVYHDTASGNAALVYQHDEATYWAAGISISNAGDDNGSTIFAPEAAVSVHRGDPADGPYTGVQYVYKGIPIFAESAATITAMGGIRREQVFDTDRVGHLATAQSEAIRWLNQHADETNTISVVITVPSAKVNLALAGQEISVKLINIPGMESGVICRIRRRDARPVAPGFWELHLELWAPRTAASDAAVENDCGVNFALGKTVTVTQTGPGAPMPSNSGEAALTDGLTTPGVSPQYGAGGHVNGSSGDYTFAFAVDLGAAHSVEEMKLYWWSSIAFEVIAAAYSATGTSGPWTDAGASGSLASPVTTLTIPAHSARYWQLTLKHAYVGLTYWPALILGGHSLLEWEVLGCTSSTPLPLTGAPVVGDPGTTSPAGTGSGVTSVPFIAGSLAVRCDGQWLIHTDVIETEPTTGAYDLIFVPDAESVIETSYLAA